MCFRFAHTLKDHFQTSDTMYVAASSNMCWALLKVFFKELFTFYWAHFTAPLFHIFLHYLLGQPVDKRAGGQKSCCTVGLLHHWGVGGRIKDSDLLSSSNIELSK